VVSSQSRAEAFWTIVPNRVVAVLGAGGWLGRSILRVASVDPSFRDWHVVGLEGESPWEDLEALASHLTPGQLPGTVVNAVGRRYGSESDLVDSNVRFVLDLVAWVQRSGWRVLQLGSAAEYGPGRSGPFSETDTPRPASSYGKSKLSATEALSDILGPSSSCVGRLFNVLGPNPPRGSVAADIRTKILEAQELSKAPALSSPDTVRDFLLLDDASRLLLALIPEIGRNQIVNICSGQGLTWRQIADAVCPALEPESRGEAESHPDMVVGNPTLLHSLVSAPPPPNPKSLALSLLG
jgi:nucleoside-diphosphate-sugar epimerase